MSSAQLPQPELWRGKIYSGGCREAAEGTVIVTVKANGEVLGQIGLASASDIQVVVELAEAAQREWATWPGPQRGDVLREVSQLIPKHGKEISRQIGRETGSIQPKEQPEVHMTSREILEATAPGSLPQSIVTASAEVGRHSIARRIPLGVIGAASGISVFDGEIFGPVASITTFRDDEAVRLANQISFGLVAMIASADLAHAQRTPTDCVPASLTSTLRPCCTKSIDRSGASAHLETDTTTIR